MIGRKYYSLVHNVLAFLNIQFLSSVTHYSLPNDTNNGRDRGGTARQRHELGRLQVVRDWLVARPGRPRKLKFRGRGWEWWGEFGGQQGQTTFTYLFLMVKWLLDTLKLHTWLTVYFPWTVLL